MGVRCRIFRQSDRGNAESDFQPLPGREGPGSRQRGQILDGLERRIVTFGGVVEQGKLANIGDIGEPHRLLPGRVTPADPVAVLVRGVHRVVDQQIGTQAEAHQSIVMDARPMFVIGDVADCLITVRDPIRCRSSRMVQGGGRDQDTSTEVQCVACGEVPIGDVGAERLGRDRQQWRDHELSEDVAQAIGRGQMPSPEPDGVLRAENRREERQPDQVIDVAMGEKKIDVERLCLGRQARSQCSQPASGVKNDEAITASDFEAGGVAAVFERGRTRGRNGPPDPQNRTRIPFIVAPAASLDQVDELIGPKDGTFS